MKRFGIELFIVLLILAGCVRAAAAPQTDKTVKRNVNWVKVAYLEKISLLTQWPDSGRINDPLKPFTIGILGDAPFKPIIKKAFKGRKIDGKTVTIRFLSDYKGIVDCHVLFIAQCSQKELEKILSYCKGKPILTVADTNGFGRKGVHINFFEIERRLRFEVNVSAMKESSISASRYLLQSGEIIIFKEGEEAK